jgi:hypothetical protein
MKKFIFLLGYIILHGIFTLAYSQTYFNNRYDFNNESGPEYAENIVDEANSFLIQLDGEISGNLIWRKYYGSKPNVWYLPRDVTRTPDGGFCLSAGHYPDGSTSQDDDPILIKTDSLGNQLWLLFLGNSQCLEEYAVVDLAKDGNIQCGSSFSDTCAWNKRLSFISTHRERNLSYTILQAGSF